MSRKLQENLIIGLIIAVLTGVIYVSLGYGPRARMVPIPVAAFGLVMAIVQLIWQNLRSTEELHVDLLEVLTKRSEAGQGAGAPTEPPAAAGTKEAPRRLWPKELAALALVLGFLGLVLLIGPIPSIFIFTGGYFLVSRHYSWPKALGYTAIFTIVVYLLFVVALEIQLYHGAIEPLVEYFR
jgi:Tripartite tricarboxylate transporter TctB family